MSAEHNVSGMFVLLLSLGFIFVNNFKKNTGNVFLINLSTFYMTNLTCRGPCIVMYSYNESQ